MKKGRNLFITITLVMVAVNALSQQTFKLVPESSLLKVSGTSSLHDWEMSVEKFNCEVSAIIGNPVITIEKVNFTGVSSSVASDNSTMDKKAQEALKVEKFPVIKFKLTTPLELQPKGLVFNATVKGELSIGGNTKIVSLPVNGKIISGNTILINGSKIIDMTEFGIQPPTAMLGALKTGKEVTISFTMNLQTKDGLANK